MSCLRFAAIDVSRPVRQCVFCNPSVEKGFNIIFEDQDYIAFKDRSPAAEHHILVIPRTHVATVKTLSQADVPMLTAMKDIGVRIFDDLDVPVDKRRIGFHIPPFNSISHLHLHLISLPVRGIRKFEFPASEGEGGKSKGFSWFVEVDQAIELLQREKSIGVFPC